MLHVGGYGYVNSVILSAAGGLDVEVDNNGQLFIANTQGTGSVNARNLNVNGGVLGLTISQTTSNSTPVVLASKQATISSTAADRPAVRQLHLLGPPGQAHARRPSP